MLLFYCFKELLIKISMQNLVAISKICSEDFLPIDCVAVNLCLLVSALCLPVQMLNQCACVCPMRLVLICRRKWDCKHLAERMSGNEMRALELAKQEILTDRDPHWSTHAVLRAICIYIYIFSHMCSNVNAH